MRDDTFKDFIVDQLAALGAVASRKMFGGYGLYQKDIFFAIIYNGRLYFKVTAVTVTSYREHGMKPFRPNAKQTLTSYYEVPVDVLEDAERLTTGPKRPCACRGLHESPVMHRPARRRALLNVCGPNRLVR
ncbi:MAG: TfoX/Sxy family protein [Nitrospirales bacterium]|nr:TfoX/Sxy family protein [Nitrospirales bacterium]